MVVVFRYFAKTVCVSSTVGHDFIPLEIGNVPSAAHVTENTTVRNITYITLHCIRHPGSCHYFLQLSSRFHSLESLQKLGTR